MLTDRLASYIRDLKGGIIGGRWLGRYHRERLTVICYHRVWPAGDPRFAGYKPTISASPEVFAQHIDYIRERHNPISASDLAHWLEGTGTLPPRPALITFDDGYRDNAEIAWPILRERGVPAVIFLATDYIGTGRAFLWDFAAYCFSKCKATSVEIPLIGATNLSSATQRDAATIAWVEAAKLLPGALRDEAVVALAEALGVAMPEPDAFQHLYMDWTDVQRLSQEGVEFGGHTHTHPILTRLPLDESCAEIDVSIERLTAALGARPRAFAYPNGSAQDFSVDHEQTAQRAGISMGFSLEPGPQPLAQVRARPMAIRRIYVGERDSLPRFIAKVNGAARLGEMLHRPNRFFAFRPSENGPSLNRGRAS